MFLIEHSSLLSLTETRTYLCTYIKHCAVFTSDSPYNSFQFPASFHSFADPSSIEVNHMLKRVLEIKFTNKVQHVDIFIGEYIQDVRWLHIQTVCEVILTVSKSFDMYNFKQW